MQVHDLHHTYLFQELSSSEVEEISASAGEYTCEPGDYIYQKGDKGDAFYLILDGKVELILEKHGKMACIAGHIDAGGHFGENSLLTGRPRSLTVRALEKTSLLVFDADAFKNVLLANQAVHAMLDRALAERLTLASDILLESGRSAQFLHESAFPASSGVIPPISDEEGSHGGNRENEYSGIEEYGLARKIRKKVDRFASGFTPVLINGENGTGRRLTAKQIHLRSVRAAQPFIELDLAQFDAWIWGGKLFGIREDSFPYSAGRQQGILEQSKNGTLVLYHAENMSRELQKKIYDAFTTGVFTPVDGTTEKPLNARLIVITTGNLETLEKEDIFIPELIELFRPYQFTLPPLREHKEDILPLIDYYLKQYSTELNKKVSKISPDALGMLVKYDWPGNLTELSNVIHRAVMISPSDKIVSEQIFFGLPRVEGKLAYNLLRLPQVRNFFEKNFQQVFSRVVLVLFFGIVLVLFFGPQDADMNFGAALCWYFGWPLLMISFFFLPRFWCSICAMSAPGKWLQKFVQPTRRLPAFLADRAGWIMAMLCLAVFWAEIVFNAYDNPRLTGMIFLSIAFGSFLFSMFFERYTWCRYLCPLGGLNAVFSMPSILELRANRQMCVNQCQDHACYLGTEKVPGCPMFRHPFLVDNNKDCILCGRCIRNCELRSIELNLRLAPQELWTIQNTRISDSFLIVSLGAVYFFLVFHEQFLAVIEKAEFFPFAGRYGYALTGSALFWGMIAVGWLAYLLFCWFQDMFTGEYYRKVASVFGYGLIPLVLGGYLAYYAGMFIQGAWKIIPNFLLLFGVDRKINAFSLLTADATSTLLHIIILGGLAASLYATYKIFRRLEGSNLSFRHLVLPFMLLLGFGFTYLAAI
jgi:CRP-like cAMP-binding protein/NAD-dependent dihydropyrimidine dehydrogenase PreA subunit